MKKILFGIALLLAATFCLICSLAGDGILRYLQYAAFLFAVVGLGYAVFGMFGEE